MSSEILDTIRMKLDAIARDPLDDEPVNDAAIETAWAFAKRFFSDVPEGPQVFPTHDDGVQFEFGKLYPSLDFEFDSTQRIEYVQFRADGCDDDGTTDLADADHIEALIGAYFEDLEIAGKVV